MAAAVVYQGVGGGGTLFRGIKFHLLMRIPTRNTWKDLVTQNGGEIVPLERQADIVIADHARKDQPVGSLSWTFIESSVKSGKLADKEEHRAGPATHTSRPVGSTQPAKKGRTPFTPEDDRVLMRWCTKAERQGLSLRGNEIYEQLEAINNRHTYQSWRDRWIKYVSTQPRPDDRIEDDDENIDDEVNKQNEQIEELGPSRRITARAPAVKAAAPRSAALRPTPRPALPPARSTSRDEPAASRINSSVGSSPIQRSPTSNPFKQRSAGGNVFTDDETQELRNNYEDIINLEEDQVIDAWIAWATMYPNHTAQEWRNHFTEYLIPKVTAEEKRKRLKAEQARLRPQEPRIIQTIPGPNAPKSAQRQTLEVKDSQGSSGETLQSPRYEIKAVDVSLTNEAVFKHEVSVLAEALKIGVSFEPVICGKVVPLFKLWQLVESEEFGGFDEVQGRGLWHKIAKRLKFNENRHPAAAAELADCFSELLADYEEQKREEPEEVSPTASQEEALINDQLWQNAAGETRSLEDEEDEEDDDDLDRPQSTPRQPLSSPPSKRNLDVRRQDTLSNKRQRIDKGKGREVEIPSTPEEVINGNQKMKPSFQPSPLRYGSSRLNQYDDGDEDDLYLRSRPFEQALSSAMEPSHPSRIIEPETQDFQYLSQHEDNTHAMSEDLTPSPEQSSSKLPDRSKASDVATHGTAHSSNKNEDSSTQSQTESQRFAEVQQCVDHYISMGYPQDIVIEALETTCMDPTNAGHVMEQLMSGNGIPEDIRGVFTWDDDEALKKRKDTPQFERVVKKHGIKLVGTRKRFLREARQAERIAKLQVDAQNGGGVS